MAAKVSAYPTTLDTLASMPALAGLGADAPEGTREHLLKEMLDAVIALQIRSGLSGAGVPKSGTAGTGAGGLAVTYFDTTGQMLYVNEGTSASPYWSPVWMPGLFNTIGVREDFRGGVLSLMPIAGNAMSAYMDSGARIFGDGHADSDSGVIPAAPSGEGGRAHGIFTTTNEDLHTINIGGPTVSYQPDQHGRAIIDCEFATITDLTNRSHFVGFVGGAIDAMVAPATIASTTITNVLPDLVGMVMDASATDADGLFVTDNAANGNATVGTADAGRDLSSPLVAGTFKRLRVEVDVDGAFRCFEAKLLVYTGSAADVAINQELSPILQLEAAEAAVIKTMHVRSYMHIWNREV